MTDNKKNTSGFGKKFAAAVGILGLGAGLALGGAAAVNGVDRTKAEGTTPAGHPASLRTFEIKPFIEWQKYESATSKAWCFSVASIKCPIPVVENEKPTYDALKNQPKP